jgi:hypothetical protein
METARSVVAVEVAGEPGPGEGGFLTLIRLKYRNVYADGGRSRPYLYEYIHRRGYDAVAIGLFHEEEGIPAMAWRPGIRVPVCFRRDLTLAVSDPRHYLTVPEAVAGSLEPGDGGADGVLRRVVEEVLEEAGFQILPGDVIPLGGGFFPSHGQSSEKIHLCAARVNPALRGEAGGDGSVNETDAPPVRFSPLRDILLASARGEMEDPKLEILAWRLCLYLKYLPLEGRYARPEERPAFEEFSWALRSGGWLSGREFSP